MKLKKVEIIKYKNFENIVIDFENNNFSNVYSIASENGGGKSMLLQLIFTVLHSFIDENKKKYINNLLEDYSYKVDKKIDFIKFEIIYNNKNYYLEFFLTPIYWQNMDFNLYSDLKDLYREIELNKIKQSKYQTIYSLKELLQNFNRLTPLFKNNFREAENIFVEIGLANDYEELRIEVNNNKIVEDYKELIDKALKNSYLKFIDTKQLEMTYQDTKKDLNNLKINLENQHLKYITHIQNNSILLLKTDIDNILLQELSNRVFLTAPNSQPFNFLKKDDKVEIFDSLISYSSVLEEVKKDLNNFYTYDFIATDIILEAFKNAFDEDLNIKRKTKKYGNRYDELSDRLKILLKDKEIIENEDGTKVIFKLKNSDIELSPQSLSHGELKRVAIFIWLEHIVPKNSIILMDEIDIALHPKWQYELVDDLTKWSNSSQILLATHSPQILSSTYYKNIIKLENGEVKRYNKPPIDRDINAIITEVMDAPTFPENLLEFHKEYREFINNGKVNTVEAKKLKEKILEYESESSSFFQEINFDLELI
ncbi:hypothetical protein MNB_SV-15-20 [hydrothermal vent metagenome]|uniref:ATPase AAA-type core domain-containing protein n=1 Tax=hydrothermal vent metagenome TaxID=652676 RepID=A0A1W1EJB9_9ZZZZ